MSLFDKIKVMGKGVVDAGAKQMLKVDITLLDREIKTRKQEFGIQIYDLMEELESNDALSVEEKEAKIRAAFDAARKDIAVIRAKKDCKQEEISLLEVQAGGGNASTDYNIPPSSGAVITNEHPADASLS